MRLCFAALTLTLAIGCDAPPTSSPLADASLADGGAAPDLAAPRDAGAPAMVTFDVVSCAVAATSDHCDVPLAGATITVDDVPPRVQVANGDGYTIWTVPATLVDTHITIEANGYERFDSGNVHPADLTAQHNIYTPRPSLPAAPTREQVLTVKLTFQGLTVDTKQFGKLPWFEAALPWMTADDRQAVYGAKHAAGDTHAILAVPSGPPLYDEPNQPYNAQSFPAKDWTGGATRMDPAFVALVVEEIRNGFTPVIFLDERREVSMATLPLVIDALQHDIGVDLTPYVLIMPGWDGVFYGWEPSATVIPAWAALARSKCPACHLGIEFNTGHIPVGGGPGDYEPGGPMQDFDILFVEFDDSNIHDDATWQILGRLLGPAYHRPPDQPATDDPSPPFYLHAPNARGPWHVNCFEYGEYEWVRGEYTAAQIDAMRAYLHTAGCPVVD